MIDRIIKAEDYKAGVRLPKRGTFLQVSNDGANWEHKYFIQLETDQKRPFVCVDMERDIHFPASRGKLYSIIRVSEYEVDDIIMFEKKFLTRDNLYETSMDPNSRNYYWDRTSHARSIGMKMFFLNKVNDVIYVNSNFIEHAVKILNNLVT